MDGSRTNKTSRKIFRRKNSNFGSLNERKDLNKDDKIENRKFKSKFYREEKIPAANRAEETQKRSYNKDNRSFNFMAEPNADIRGEPPLEITSRVNGTPTQILIDTVASRNYISNEFAQRSGLIIDNHKSSVHT